MTVRAEAKSGRHTRTLRWPNWPTVERPRIRSLFLQQALEEEHWDPSQVQRLTGEQNFDICIIGGGFTGLWTAYRLKQQESAIRVAVIEADICGAGASGRNSGAVVSWWIKFAKLTKLLGKEEAVWLCLSALRAIDDIEAFCLDRGNRPHFARDGSLWVATSRAQLDSWRSVLEASDDAKLVSFESIEGTDILERIGGTPHVGGVIDRSAGTVQPAQLARELRRAVAELGVDVFEQSPVTELVSGDRLLVRCPTGAIHAQKIVLAMNAWMAGLPDFTNLIVPVSSDIVVTETIAGRLQKHRWPKRLQVHNSLMMVDYYGPTWDGRMLFGRGGGNFAFGAHITDKFDYSDIQEREVTREMHAILPWLSETKITNAWSGPVDRCETSMPWFSTLSDDDRIHYGIGYSGSGVCASALGGRILAAQVLGNNDEWTGLATPLNRMAGGKRLPPEPIRFVGGLVLREAVKRKERAESRGTKPSPIASYLTRFVPGGLLDLKRTVGSKQTGE